MKSSLVSEEINQLEINFGVLSEEKKNRTQSIYI